MADSTRATSQLEADELALTELVAPPDSAATTIEPHMIEKWRLSGKHNTRAQLAKLNHSRSHSNNKIKQVKATIKEYSCSLLSHHNQRKKTLYEVQKVINLIN